MGRPEKERRTRGRSGHRRLWVLILILPMAFIAGLTAATLWPWTVTPPVAPSEGVVVYLTDYGHHSRLALQVDDRRMVEYTFGDWRYYARGEGTVWRGFLALATPSRAGLGRRDLPFIADEAAFTQVAGAVRVARVEVERADVNALLEALAGRYEAARPTEVEAPWMGMTFVEDVRPYHLFHNSNHQTAVWLRALGCQVGGIPILSNFRLR